MTQFMTMKRWKWAVNLCFYGGVILGVYALGSIYFETATGACPIDSRRPLMIVGVTLLLLSLGGQLWIEKTEKNAHKEQGQVDSDEAQKHDDL